MKRKKKIVLFSSAIVFLGFIWYFGWGFIDYLDFVKTAESSSGLPWQDGGRITMVRQPCILDTPASSPTTCAISCPLVTSVLGPACTGYIEINTAGQKGTTFIAAPVGFVYRGGGTFPVAGMSFLAGGSSPVQPWVIGIPSAAASRTQKLVDAGKYLVAFFK